VQRGSRSSASKKPQTTGMLTELEQKLAHFNRKERFLLVGQALGNPAFALGEPFRNSLAELLHRPVPHEAYCAMDYHLDWLFAAVMWAEGKVHPGNLMPREFVASATGMPTDLTVTGNQSDIDLLIAWTDSRNRGQIALLEAKGFSGWSNKQMGYKLARLGAMFGEADSPRFEDVDVHLVLVGPKPPTDLELLGPSWALGPEGGKAKYFLPLHPPATETFAVQRVTNDRKPSKTGSHWVISPAPWGG
jgi:hypothetical protein